MSTVSTELAPTSVLTVLNLKGGVGKTHTVWLLASVCQARRKRVLCLDTDTQGNLSGSFLPEEDRTPGIESLFYPATDRDVTSLIRRTTFSHIDVLPAGAALPRIRAARSRPGGP